MATYFDKGNQLFNRFQYFVDFTDDLIIAQNLFVLKLLGFTLLLIGLEVLEYVLVDIIRILK